MAKKDILPHKHTYTATQESCNEIRLSIHQIRHTSAKTLGGGRRV